MKAVVFVDVQRDLVSGPLSLQDSASVTQKIIKFAEECVSNGYKLYATRDAHEDPIKETDSLNQQNALRYEGSPGWMIDDQLMEVLDGKCTFVNKATFGSFDLAEIIAEDDLRQTNTHNYLAGGNHNLRKSVLEEIIVCGFNTSECVLANAVILKNKFPKTSIIVIKDLCSDISRERHELALRAMNAQKIEVI